jgi:hypothetical protein
MDSVENRAFNERIAEFLALLRSSEMQKLPAAMRETFQSMWAIGIVSCCGRNLVV